MGRSVPGESHCWESRTVSGGLATFSGRVALAELLVRKMWNRYGVHIIFLAALVLRIGALLYVHDFTEPVMYEYGVITGHLLAGQGYSYFIVSNDGRVVEPLLLQDYKPMSCEPVYRALPTAFHPPGYTFFVYFFMRLFGPQSHLTFVLLEFTQALLGSLTVLLIYLIAAELFDSKTALVAGSLAAVYPVFVFMPSRVSNVTLICFLYCLSAYLLLRLPKFPVVKNGILSGFVIGITLLSRTETALYLPFLLLWVYLTVPRETSGRVLASLLVTALLAVSPWALRNYLAFGRFVPTSATLGYNLWTGHHRGATGQGQESLDYVKDERLQAEVKSIPITNSWEVDRDKVFLKEALAFIKNNPLAELRLAANKFLAFWGIATYDPRTRNPLYLYPWFVVLAFFVVGLAHTFRGGDRRKVSLLWLWLILATLTAMVFFAFPRLRLYIEPFVIIICAYGVMKSYLAVRTKIAPVSRVLT